MKMCRGVMIGGAVLTLVGLMSFPRLLFGSDPARAKELIQQACVQCHRLEGQAEQRHRIKYRGWNGRCARHGECGDQLRPERLRQGQRTKEAAED